MTPARANSARGRKGDKRQRAPLASAASSLRHARGDHWQWRRAQFRFNQRLIARRLSALDGRDIGRGAIAPPNIGIAGLDTHCFGNELNPVPDSDVVAAVERCELAMAWMKDRARGV